MTRTGAWQRYTEVPFPKLDHYTYEHSAQQYPKGTWITSIGWWRTVLIIL